MRRLIIIFSLLTFSGITRAEMVPSESIGNNPENEKLCASRAKIKPVPFLIDSAYVARARARNPDVAFIASDNGQLIDCYLREGTGRFEPASYSGESSYFHLIKPRQFEPGINTDKGIAMATNTCIEAVPAKINKPNFDHIVRMSVVEIDNTGPHYRAGLIIGGKKAARYDIAVTGTSFYKSSGPDLTAVNFTCLLSPMLDILAIQFK